MTYAGGLFGQVTISSNTTWDNNFFPPTNVDDGVIITNGATLNISDITIFMKNAAAISVEPGSKLIVTNATLDCINPHPATWTGITALGDAAIEQYATPPSDITNSINNWEGTLNNNQTTILLENAFIKNAEIGVKSEFGAIVRARNTNFLDCKRGARVSLYESTNWPELNASYFMDCNFIWELTRSTYQFGIVTSSVKTINIGGCIFANNIPITTASGFCAGPNIAGIVIYDSYVNIATSGNTFCYDNEMNCPDNCYDELKGNNCSFENLKFAIYNRDDFRNVLSVPSRISVRYANFNNNLYAVYLYNIIGINENNFIAVANNFQSDLATISQHFGSPDWCTTPDGYSTYPTNRKIEMYLNNFNHVVYKNTFSSDGKNISKIVVHDGTSNYNHKGHIINNTFTNNDPTTIASDLVFGVVAVGPNDMTKVSCNLFENMGTDIRISTGATLQNPMTDKNENAAGNTFSNILNGRYRIDNSGNPIIDYKIELNVFPGFSEHPTEPTSSLNVNTSNAYTETEPSCELECNELYTNNWGLSTRDIQYKSNQFRIFPNPASAELNISTLSGDITRILIYDVQGKVVYNNSPNTFKITVDIQGLPKGLYLVAITDNNNQNYSTKIIKE